MPIIDHCRAEAILSKILAKTTVTCERIGDNIPYTPLNGRYSAESEKDLAWWCNGFFAGMLWQLYHASKDEIFRKKAENIERRLDETFHDFVGLHHDVGFMWLHTAVANYRLTGNEQSKKRGLHAASILAGRYDPEAYFINAWNHHRGWTIIDTMMNLPLLHWAAQIDRQPHYKYIAMEHAITANEILVRHDGSVAHLAVMDRKTGKASEYPAGQGYASGSSWTRGTAWAIYGYALSHLHGNDAASDHHLKDGEFLGYAKQLAHYFIANVAQTGWIAPIDFRQPAEPEVFDTTAGLIAACGLLEIAKHVDEHEKALYINAAHNIIASTETKWADWSHNSDGIIGGGSESYGNPNTHHVPIIYGDYFFTEAILRILGKEFLIW